MKKTRLLLFYSGLFLFLCFSSAISAQQNIDSINWGIDTIFKKYINTKGPGCAIAVLENGKVVFKKNYGLANLEYNQPITSASIFDLASVTKQFTGLVISTLIQQGKLSLNDDVRKYLPQVPDFGKVITINNLVHHTSGLRDYPEALMMAGWRYSELCSLDDVMKFVTHQKELGFAPNSKQVYCNTDYVLLAAIVEKITGKSFPEWVKQNIFQPLEMNSSFILNNSNTVIPGLATSYTATDEGYSKRTDILSSYGSSCMYSSIDNLVKWVIHFQKMLQLKDSVYMRMLEGSVLDDGEKVNYGFGLELDNYQGLRIIFHSGAWAGYRTIIANYPEQNFAIIILCNSNDDDISGLDTRQLSSLFLKQYFKRNDEEIKKIKSLPDIKLADNILKKYTGTFSPDGHSDVHISYTIENGQLVGHNGAVNFSLKAKNDSCFYNPSDDGTITFITNGRKFANGFIFSNGSVSVHSSRVIITNEKKENFSPSAEQLKQYTGTFYSDELETFYRIDIQNDKLTIHHFRRGDFELTAKPDKQNEFKSDIGTIDFYVSKQNKVSGFFLSGDRVIDMRFSKQ